MKARSERYRAECDFAPVIPNPFGVSKLVFDFVSVADPLTPKPLLRLQLEVEPMAGIDQNSLYSQANLTIKIQNSRAFDFC